jgi:DNA-binding winged helix-turn-helix (wHTH) protein
MAAKGGAMGLTGIDEVVFGPFRLALRQRTLSGPRGTVALKSRAFDLLITLIERRAEVVTKDELLRRVWGGLSVEENNLHVQVAAIRRALEDGERYILTVPGRGYRFIGVLDEPPVTNLPPRMTALVGREAELAGVTDLLERARLVTLTGPSGAGKTKLAFEAARGLRERFPAGRWWAGLGSVSDGGLTVRAVAASLRTDEIREKPLIEGLVEVLGRGPVLLVLDGCERVAAAAAALVRDLLDRCPGLTVLATSHGGLGVEGECVRRLAPLRPLPAPRTPRPGIALGRSFAEPVWEDDIRSAAAPRSADPPRPRRRPEPRLSS